MLVEHRRNKIKELLLAEKSVKVADLVARFAVSEETIRRDLNFLEEQGLVKKIYGGAILVDELISTMEKIPPVQTRQSQFYQEKNAIGAKALELVGEKQIVILDAGTTTWCVAKHLKELTGMTFVTNGLNVAEECSKSDDSNVFLIGGKLIKKSMSLVGPQAMNELQKYNANIAFIGATGVSLEKGMTSSDIYEAEVKRAMVAAAQKVVIVADHSKFERQGLISFCALDEVDVIITTDQVDPVVSNEMEKLGIKMLICPLDPELNQPVAGEGGGGD